jgi:hypothetical protein
VNLTKTRPGAGKLSHAYDPVFALKQAGFDLFLSISNIQHGPPNVQGRKSRRSVVLLLRLEIPGNQNKAAIAARLSHPLQFSFFLKPANPKGCQQTNN